MKNTARDRMISHALTVVGSAFLWAWGYLAYLSPVPFMSQVATTSLGIENGFFTSQLVVVVFSAGIALVSRKHQFRAPLNIYVIAAGVVSLSTVMIVLTLQGLLPGWVFYLTGVLNGVAVPLLGVAWGTRYSVGPSAHFRMGTLILLSFLVAYAMYLTIIMFPPKVAVLIMCAAPLISWLAWRIDAHLRHRLHEEVEPAFQGKNQEASLDEISMGLRAFRILPWRLMSIIAFTSFLANLIVSYLLGWEYTAVETVTGSFYIVALIAGMLCVLSVLAKNSLSVKAAYRYSLPFAVLGFIVILVFGGTGMILGGALINGCGMFMQCLVIYKVTESTQQKGISPLFAFSIAQGAVAGMVFLGNIAGKGLFAAVGLSSLALDVLCAVGVMTLFVMVLNLLKNKDAAREFEEGESLEEWEWSAEAPAVLPAADKSLAHDSVPSAAKLLSSARLAQQIDNALVSGSFASNYGLTPREIEILALLGRGWSLPYIAQELFITTGTVKTHTTHIYQKLGINKRQELINMIESLS